ncbi:MAG: GNAT family N-acetyltransferase [Candidatus Hodarchaeales archaeon]|jgi:ribosomal protein S18 acetylase RimI-like enzyme
MITIKRMNESNFNQAINFISRLQSINSQHIGYFGTTPEEIDPYIKQLEPGWEDTSLLAYEETEIIGLMIIEYDLELQRAWIHGPMVTHRNWHTIAEDLFQSAKQKIIPERIEDLELFGDITNENLRNKSESNSKIDDVQDPHIIELNEQYYSSVEFLHDKMWPTSYYSGKQIIEKLDERTKIFINVDGDKLRGYIRGGVEPGGKEGYIGFVSVDESERRLGIGISLVNVMTRWLLSSFDIESVGLNVYDTNTAALNLYKKVGYEYVRSVQGYRIKPNSI